ncbi:hypothetical protein, partial [Candidatus Entotheonella palauensis]|uniref:hypothetical protein n=1 Tax=Candidatus Entotheonella palauensis TaxID=93172 RepID=UPI0015C4DE4E
PAAMHRQNPRIFSWITVEFSPVLDRLYTQFGLWGDGRDVAMHKAMATLNNRLHTHAAVRAYQECYLGLALLYAALLLPVWAMHRRYTVPGHED